MEKPTRLSEETLKEYEGRLSRFTLEEYAIPDGLEYVNPDEPEKGFQLKHPNRNRFVPEYSQKLGEMSLSDGVPIIHKAPEPIPPVPLPESEWWGD